jgi:hypothetical protein
MSLSLLQPLPHHNCHNDNATAIATLSLPQPHGLCHHDIVSTIVRCITMARLCVLFHTSVTKRLQQIIILMYLWVLCLLGCSVSARNHNHHDGRCYHHFRQTPHPGVLSSRLPYHRQRTMALVEEPSVQSFHHHSIRHYPNHCQGLFQQETAQNTSGGNQCGQVSRALRSRFRSYQILH